jgi:sec-independent protein translocase protein TatC
VCLFRGVIGIVLGCVIGFIFANQVVRFFQSPLEDAMERYYVDKALGDYRMRYGDVPIEVQRQVLDEGLIPEDLHLDLAEIARALRLTYPEQFSGLDISPYWFTAGDIVPDGALALCRDWHAARERTGSPRNRLWQMLSEDQRAVIERLAGQTAPPSDDDFRQLLEILNDLAGRREVHEAEEFAGLTGPDANFTSTWTNRLLAAFGRKPEKQADAVADIRGKLAQGFNAEQSRRLNKLLIARAFPDSLKKARLNLLSLLSWRPVKVRFQVLNAQEAFMIWMKAAIMTGLFLASPYVFYQIWVFVAAGLYPHEKHYVYLYLPISMALFFGGASLAFVFVFDPVLDFLFTFNRGMNADFDPRIGEWLSFVLILPIGFGISFQLPLVMLFLNRIGVASLDFYIQQWRIAILIICVVSMVLTPADPVSMLLMAAPLSLLYVLGILMCKYMPARRSPFAEAYEP